MRFVKPLEQYLNCEEGQESLVLECVVNQPDTFSEWFKDNQPIVISSVSSKYDTLNLEGKKHRLYIKHLNEGDSGVYTCRVNSELESSCLLNVSAEQPLKILQNLPSDVIHLKEGDTSVQFAIELNRPVANKSNVIVKWFYNKAEIRPGNFYFLIFLFLFYDSILK